MSKWHCTLEGFMKRFEVDSNGCWIWTGRFYAPRPGTRDEIDGTWGKFDGGPAYRFGWRHLVGPIPPEVHLDHLCRVRACVNPAHLEPVSPHQNNERSPTCIPTVNAAKTHCVKGHEFTPENTMLVRSATSRSGTRRQCRECNRESVRAWRQRQKESA